MAAPSPPSFYPTPADFAAADHSLLTWLIRYRVYVMSTLRTWLSDEHMRQHREGFIEITARSPVQLTALQRVVDELRLMYPRVELLSELVDCYEDPLTGESRTSPSDTCFIIIKWGDTDNANTCSKASPG
jgi:hypothetical protein